MLQLKENLALVKCFTIIPCQSCCDEIGEVFFRLYILGSNGFHVKAENNERFNVAGSRSRQNLQVKISSCHSADYVKRGGTKKRAARAARLFFLIQTNQIIDLWRCRCCCRRRFLNPLLGSLRSTMRR